MFLDTDIKGKALPDKTLCLTYDDGPGDSSGEGPGPKTLELGRFLYEQGIPAAFFVIGCHAECRRQILCQLRDWQHLIGNHTYRHPGLVQLALNRKDVVGEIARTDAIIRPYVVSPVVPFRPPYGN